MISSCQNNGKKSLNQEDKKGQTSIEVNNNIQLFRIAYNLAIADSIDIEYRPCNNTLYKATKKRLLSFDLLNLELQ